MYPHRELRRLAAHKAALRQRIAARRAQCTVLAGRALRPLAWVDRARALWRRVAPFAGLALGALGLAARHRESATSSWPARLLRWIPSVLGAVRSVRRAWAPPVR
jgi:hypothetical protein